MSESKDPVKHMLNLALATALNDLQYYADEFEKTKIPEVQALLLVLQESEEEFIAKIEDMMFTGVFSTIEEAQGIHGKWPPPSSDPFDFTSPFGSTLQFQRVTVCNQVLERGLKSHKFYLSISSRAKSKVVGMVFEYLAYLKGQHLERMRRVCESFAPLSEEPSESSITWSSDE
ncbi:MAG: hypothetical protein EAX95_00150 [Candidatus Thorarchaeota archaeon]|nr:hypothetical protein [Candidatus Thorarchaeota archaeon]